MLFITNKKLVKSGSHYKFKDSNEISQSLHYCEMINKTEFKEIKSKPFMGKLKDPKGPKEILFYIHGFNNQPIQDVFPRAKAMQSQLIDNGLKETIVVPIIWPCDNDFGIIKDYWDDQDSAEMSGKIFARSLSKLLAWQQENASDPCMKRMHVFVHSMGGEVLVQCLKHWANTFGGGGVPYLFKNIFLMAADIPNETLEKGEEGEHISKAAQRVISYYANDDFSMPASKISNMRNRVFSRRIGHTGPEDMTKVPNNVYAVNCDAFNNKFDKPKGHAYFIDLKKSSSPAFQHIVKILKTKQQDLGDKEQIL